MPCVGGSGRWAPRRVTGAHLPWGCSPGPCRGPVEACKAAPGQRTVSLTGSRVDRFAGRSTLSGPGPAPREGHSPARPSDPLCRASAIPKGAASSGEAPRPGRRHPAASRAARASRMGPAWLPLSFISSSFASAGFHLGWNVRRVQVGLRSVQRLPGGGCRRMDPRPSRRPGRARALRFLQTGPERFPCGGPRRGRVQSGRAPPWSRGPRHRRRCPRARLCLAVALARPINTAKPEENSPCR